MSSFAKLRADGGDDLTCPECKVNLSVEWDTEYGDPLIGEHRSNCPSCNKPFDWSVYHNYSTH